MDSDVLIVLLVERRGEERRGEMGGGSWRGILAGG
jgi:hypothetical protein